MSPRFVRGLLLASSSLIPFVVSEAQAQTALPEIVVESQRSAPPRPRSTTPTTTAPSPQPDSNATLAAQNTQFDTARDSLSPRFGASTFDMNRAFIETLPQGHQYPTQLGACCKRPAFHRIAPSMATSMCAMSTPTCSTASTASRLPDGISGFGRVLGIPILSAASR